MERRQTYAPDLRDVNLHRDVNLRRITVDEFHAMGEAGILSEDDRIELIDGLMIVMEPIGMPHANCVIRLTNLLVGKGPYVVSPQNPLRLSDYTEPLPDLVLLPAERDPYGPLLGPDSLLVIEVADTSLSYDRGIKLSRYAQARVRGVWIVDVNRAHIEVYRDLADDRYGSRVIRGRGESIPVPGGWEMAVADIFPPAA